jgi:hypothetical protein
MSEISDSKGRLLSIAEREMVEQTILVRSRSTSLACVYASHRVRLSSSVGLSFHCFTDYSGCILIRGWTRRFWFG